MSPPSDCLLCSAMNHQEALMHAKFRRSFAGEISLVYRRGKIRGVRELEQLGEALYQCEPVNVEVAYAD